MEIEQIYQTIEDQQNMILDLVNNVVTDRERELKKKNSMLRDRIERLEQSMALEEAKREQEFLQMNQGIPRKGKNKQNQGEYDEGDDNSSSDEDEEYDKENEDEDEEDESETEDSTVA